MQYLLNKSNGDVVPANVELLKDARFVKISESEAKRRFDKPTRVEPDPDPEPVESGGENASGDDQGNEAGESSGELRVQFDELVERIRGIDDKDVLEDLGREYGYEADKRKGVPKLQAELIAHVGETFGFKA